MTCVRALVAGIALMAVGVEPVEAEHVVAAVATVGSPHQPYGADVASAAEAAAARINVAGGILGRPVRVQAWREDCSRARAVAVAEEIVREAPALVVGHLCAGAAMAAAPIYARAGVLLIAPGVRHPSFNARPVFPTVFRLAGRDDRFARETAVFVSGRFAESAVAIIADRTQQARRLATDLAVELALHRVPVAHDERIESGEPSYASVADRVRASGAGVVLVPAQPVELAALVSSLRERGIAAPIVGSDILAVPALEPLARREAGQFFLMLPWTGLEAPAVGTHTVAAMRNSAAPIRRTATRARVEAAVEAFAAAAARAHTTDATAVAAALREAGSATVVGPLRFDVAGDALVPSYVPHVWRDGGWHPAPP